MTLMRCPVLPEREKVAKARKVRVKVKEKVSEIRPANLLMLLRQKVFATCMFEVANAQMTIVLIPICPRIKSNVHLAKEATRSETHLVAVTRMIKVPVDVEKDVAKAKANQKVKEDPEVNLRAPEMATQLRLKPLSIS